MAADSIARAASSWPRNGRARDWMTVSRIGTHWPPTGSPSWTCPSPPYTILNWLALLVENRRFQPTTTVAAQGIEYLKQVFLPDTSQSDVIVGYRADDSYFSFARAFVNNAISLDQLAEAMRLGELGKQIVLTSPQAFAALRFQGCEIARASTYHVLRNERDRTAREAYRRNSAEADLDGLFMRDIIREKVTNDDHRLR